jgi:hypothetical protein
MSSQSAPTRTLPPKPSLAQLRKQAKELLKSYRAGKDAAVAEVEQFERSPDPASFALADAQRVLARAYGYSSWIELKDHVEGVNLATFIAAVEDSDLLQGNDVGTDYTGQKPLGNSGNGIEIVGNNNTVGGNGVAVKGAGNTIGGNSGSSITYRNYIGGNSNDGVLSVPRRVMVCFCTN